MIRQNRKFLGNGLRFRERFSGAMILCLGLVMAIFSYNVEAEAHAKHEFVGQIIAVSGLGGAEYSISRVDPTELGFHIDYMTDDDVAFGKFGPYMALESRRLGCCFGSQSACAKEYDGTVVYADTLDPNSFLGVSYRNECSIFGCKYKFADVIKVKFEGNNAKNQ